MSPILVVAVGVGAGALGSLAQDLFFRATGPLAPETPKSAFQPPEPEQRNETATETLARRVVEDLMQRGPLVHKSRAGVVVHYAFGAGWGALYALVAASAPRLRGPAAALGFGALVWMASDNGLLPAFRLGAWPNRYPVSVHAYALAAHFVFGLAVWGAFRAARSALHVRA